MLRALFKSAAEMGPRSDVVIKMLMSYCPLPRSLLTYWRTQPWSWPQRNTVLSGQCERKENCCLWAGVPFLQLFWSLACPLLSLRRKQAAIFQEQGGPAPHLHLRKHSTAPEAQLPTALPHKSRLGFLFKKWGCLTPAPDSQQSPSPWRAMVP